MALKSNKETKSAALSEVEINEENEKAAEVENMPEEESVIDGATVNVESFSDSIQIEDKVKMVKVKMAKNHRCTIGGVTYNLDEGKSYNVPEEVRQILAEFPDHILAFI